MYFISENVHTCEADGHVVFLDLRRDRYIAIGRHQKELLHGKIHGWPPGVTESVARETNDEAENVISCLIARDLLTKDERSGWDASNPSIEPPEGELVDDSLFRDTRVRVSDIGAFIAACSTAAALLHMAHWRSSLVSVLRRVRRRKEHALLGKATASLERDRELVAVFNRLRPFAFTQTNMCLFDSLALVEFLARRGSFPTWIFGVRTTPFAAHAWVQNYGLAFNGSSVMARRFKPILAV